MVLRSDSPSQERFSSFQLQDDRNANYRNVVGPDGSYTLYHGERPETITGEAVEVPSLLSAVVTRIEVKIDDARQRQHKRSTHHDEGNGDARDGHGGRQSIGEDRLVDVQRNSRIGGTLVVPFLGRHAIKVGYSRGVVTEFGTHFGQLRVCYQVLIR